MGEYFPGQKTFRNLTNKNAPQSWKHSELDWKARVVCGECNNGWMSNLERLHAKPAMKDLTTAKGLDTPISQERANSIALFAFKTAVILDHMNQSRGPYFFPREVRYRFRETLDIPYNVRMWLAGFRTRTKGGCVSLYFNGKLEDGNVIELYVSNYIVGHFVFQVVAIKCQTYLSVSPMPGFEDLAVSFWPRIPNGFIWPPDTIFSTEEKFHEFAARWKKLGILNLTGGD
jgi:hypothetical protein